MPEIIFTGRDRTQDRQTVRDAAAGSLIKAARGVYVDPNNGPIEATVRRNWAVIIAHLEPDGVLTDRSGMEGQPWRERINGVASGDAWIFMSAPHARAVHSLPGLTIHVRRGVGPVEEDIPYLGTHIASEARRLLDNLSPSRARSGPSRTVGQAAVEARLDGLCAREGMGHVNALRDRARRIAPLIDREAEFDILNAMISTLLRTREAKALTPQGQARADGAPVDPACIHRLAALVSHLQQRAPLAVPDPDNVPGRRHTGAFMEAYFSNYIEGTEFPVNDAVEIVEERRVPEARPEDGHDILGTYLQLVELNDQSTVPSDPDAFLEEIRERHFRLMEARPSIRPGELKTKPNKAGGTDFVAPDLVIGTLRGGLSMMGSLSDPFARAVFLHFLLVDVHPFNDGNGRISRIMMTKSLVGSGLSRIVIPTVFRGDYFDALRALSRRGEPGAFVRALEFCQKVSAACSAQTIPGGIENWARAYGFCEDGRHARLMMPSAAVTIESRNGTPAPQDYWEAVGQPPLTPIG